MQTLLAAYIPRQRWFGAKSRAIASVEISECVKIPNANAAILLLTINYAAGEPDTYQLPLALSTGSSAQALEAAGSPAILATLSRGEEFAVLHDATSG